MFKSTSVNPYDDLVVKATSEDLIAEDWDTNLRICDKVSEEGEPGARNSISALIKRLAHRNPNVQIFSLELANSLAQNCGKVAQAEIGSRAFTSALERLVTDRTTHEKVKAKTLHFIKEWHKDWGKDPSLGTIGELYDSLRAQGITFDSAPKPKETEAERRQREEDEELQRVLELSKQDKGGRGAASNSAQAGGSASSPAAGPSGTSYPAQSSSGYPSAAQSGQHAGGSGSSSGPRPYPARESTPPPMPTKATASRVRAIYPFVTQEKGELSFERGDVIKVIDRMYDEWYTGAVGGRIGIFPISYVEPMPDPTPEELQREAQDEARVFASQGMIVQLQRMLDSLDPSRGDRVDSQEIEDLYQRVVALQPQIAALLQKYADQRAELEHIHAGFVRATRQYAAVTQQPMHPAAQAGYPGNPFPQTMAAFDPRAAQTQHPSQAMPPAGTVPMPVGSEEDQRRAAEEHRKAWEQYWAAQAAMAQQAHPQMTGSAVAAGVQPGGPEAGAPPAQTDEERAKIVEAWRQYYTSMGMPIPPQLQQDLQGAAAAAPQHHSQPYQDQSHNSSQANLYRQISAGSSRAAPGQTYSQPHASADQHPYHSAAPGEVAHGQYGQPVTTGYAGDPPYPQTTSHTGLEGQVEQLRM